MKQEIIVNVLGYTNTGKTTVAHIIQQALAAHGIEASYVDEEAGPFESSDVQTARIASVAERAKVTINEVWAQRMPQVSAAETATVWPFPTGQRP